MTDIYSFLSHYGVMGMKWGVRKDRSSNVTVNASPRKIKTSGGYDVNPSDDAVKVAAYKQRAKKSSTKSLSNKELKLVVERLNLETQYSRLNPSKVKSGHDYVKALLAVGTTVSSIYALTQSPFGKRLAAILAKKGWKL